MPQIENHDDRSKIILEILGQENQERKNVSYKRSEVYSDRAYPYILQMMRREFQQSTIDEMRKITSINLTKRITDEIASLYRRSPDRNFERPMGVQLSDQEKQQIENIYRLGRFDWSFKKANKVYELNQQCAIQVIPQGGKIALRVLAPHQYDVIPDPMNPEKPMAYVVSVHDRSRIIAGHGTGAMNYDVQNPPSGGLSIPSGSDGVNQKIADADDYKKKLMRFVWWTKEFNFLTDGTGQVLDPSTEMPTDSPDAVAPNPIGELPFVDVSMLKDSEFWVRAGSGVVEFDLEFSSLLMDTFFIHKMQGFAQAIIYSEKPPSNMKIGPNHVMHIPLDPNKELQPRFEYTSPNADLQSSLELIETFLRLFLTSRGIDPKTISGKSETQRFSSGIERLLSMIDKFEASRDSIELFGWAEQQVLALAIKWSNAFQGATTPTLNTEPLAEELRLATIPEDVTVSVNYASPEVVQTIQEREDSLIKLMESGLKSRSEVLIDLRGVSEQQALQLINKIDSEETLAGIVDGQSKEA